MLKINNLSYQYGKQEVLKNIVLETKDLGLYVFAGTNGCGKTTLFNIISGIIIPKKGKVQMNEINNADDYRKKLGISLEPFMIEPNLTISEIVEIACLQKDCSVKEAQHWLQYWELDTCQQKRFKELSVGMKKRLSIVISLLGNPPVLIWDEPFNGLDPLGIEKLQNLIKEQLNLEKLILLSTHILSEISSLVEQVIIMEDGVIKTKLNRADFNSDKETIMQWLKKENTPTEPLTI